MWDHMGFLVFCRTRAGYDNFYLWYVQTVVLPFIAEVQVHNSRQYDSSRTAAFDIVAASIALFNSQCFKYTTRG